MLIRSLVCLVTCLSIWAASICPSAASGYNTTLWYELPAQKWNEALPLGNGRLGAMVFGDASKERLQLNEESLWAGEPTDVYPERFAEHLQQVQRLTLAGKTDEARAIGLEKMTQSPTSFRSYEPLCDLWIQLDHGTEVTNYRRQLDLATGIASVSYQIGDVHYRRDVFISAVDNVIVVRLKASKQGAHRRKGLAHANRRHGGHDARRPLTHGRSNRRRRLTGRL